MAMVRQLLAAASFARAAAIEATGSTTALLVFAAIGCAGLATILEAARMWSAASAAGAAAEPAASAAVTRMES